MILHLILCFLLNITFENKRNENISLLSLKVMTLQLDKNFP